MFDSCKEAGQLLSAPPADVESMNAITIKLHFLFALGNTYF